MAPADNISAGTQIVALVEIRGPNNSLVHPRGAVGVVTRTPAGAEQHFFVRFPDGFSASLNRDQFDVLKHFKDRPGNAAPAPGFDLESTVIYRCTVGSRAYGLDHEASDTDLRGIYLAPADLQWSLFGAPEQFEDNAAQSCHWKLQKFLLMALKANPGSHLIKNRGWHSQRFGPATRREEGASPKWGCDRRTTKWPAQRSAASHLVLSIIPLFHSVVSASLLAAAGICEMASDILECLYSPLVDKITPLGEELLAIRHVFLSQMIFQTFNGYALSQFKKIGQDIRNHGEVRWKHAMHLLRLLITGAAALRIGSVPVRVESHRDRLLAVKRGELPWPDVDAWRKELHRDFEHALAQTKLPERPDYEAANRFLVNARRVTSLVKAQPDRPNPAPARG